MPPLKSPLQTLGDSNPDHTIQPEPDLSDYDDPRRLVSLLDKMSASPCSLNELSQCLWHLGPSDALLLDTPRRDAICSLLTRYFRPGKWPLRSSFVPRFTDEQCDVMIAALRAVALLGEAKARKIVGEIVDFPAQTDNERCVQEVAQEYLILLDARAALKADVQNRLLHLLHGLKPGDDINAILRPFLETITPIRAKIALVEYLENRRNASTLADVAAAVALSRYNDVRLVGPLLDAHKQLPQNGHIEYALKMLLPQLQPGDDYLLSRRNRAQLCYIVEYSKIKMARGSYRFSPELTVTALDALRVAGDEEAVEIARAVLRNRRNQLVRTAAKRLLAAAESSAASSYHQA